jgi:peptidoglycan/xylan/chitin deacetylase (PgdA/CDA1 family)
MSLGIYVKYIRSLMSHRAICRKLKSISSEHCVVLTYHRILPKDEVTDSVEPGMYVTPSTLQSHIRFLKNYFEIVAVDRIENYTAVRGYEKSQKTCCIISFDDGWLDFYTHAWPVLQEEGVPAVVYLPTSLIGTEKGFWTDRLARVLEQSGVKTLVEYLGEKVNRKVFERITSSQQQLARAIELLKEYPYQQIEDLLDACENKAGILQRSQDRTFMNWDEVRELFGTGLISFGSHTVNHAILTTLSFDEMQAELALSRQKLLAEKVVKDNISFCYPNGNYTSEIAMLIANNGFSLAMTCDPGWNIAGENLFMLKRISLHQDISFTKALFAYRLVQYY